MPKELILFEEGDWSLQQNWYKNDHASWYGPVKIAHKHTNWLGRDRWVPSNMGDDGSFYNFGHRNAPKEWWDQCSKCGDNPPSEVKTRFRLLDDE